MTSFAAPSLREYPASLWAAATVTGGLIVGLAVFAGFGVWVVTAVSVAGLLLPALLRTQTDWFVAAVLGFAFIAGRDPGVQWYEAAFGVFYLGYLSVYVGARVWTRSERLIESGVDLAILFYVAWTTLSISWALWLGAEGGALLSEWLCVASLLYYFPAKDVARRVGGERLIVVLLLLLAAFVAIRNLINYREVVLYAAIGWEFKSRVTTNEILLVTGCVGFLVFASYAHRFRTQFGWLVCFGVLFCSLIITQTRAFWVDFAFAVLWLALLVRGAPRLRLFLHLVVGGAVVVVLAYIILGNTLFVLALGFLERAASIGSSVQKDLSLISRFYEANAVMERVWLNPFTGYGPGVPFSFYDIIDDATISRTFVHNGFVGLLYKAGLIGTLPILWAWAALIWRGIRLCYSRFTSPSLVVLAALLLAMLPSATTAMQFYASDIAFVFALIAGGVSGVWYRRVDESRRA